MVFQTASLVFVGFGSGSKERFCKHQSENQAEYEAQQSGDHEAVVEDVFADSG